MTVNIFSMPSSSALLLFSLAFGLSSARPWHGATKTVAYQADEWSPRPTNVPVNPRDLFKRKHLGVEVCGWLGGNSASVVACGSGSSCVHDTAHGYVGCCATSGPCTTGVYTSCVDESSSNWGYDSRLVNDGIFTCPGGQSCYKNSYPGGYHQYNCGSSDQATTVLTSYSGQPTDILLQIVFTGVVFSPSAAPTTTSTSSSPNSPASISYSSSLTSPSQTSTSTLSSSTELSSSSTISSSSTSSISLEAPNAAAVAAAAATTTATVHSNSSNNTKAIVGGVVGGLAALTAILGVLLFLLQRRHAQRNQQRAGSFITGHKNGQTPLNGPFQRIAPYSPDDFQRSMSERQAPTPSTIANAFPNNHLTPPLPDIPIAFLPANQGSEERGGEVAPLVSSEINDFSSSYNEATRYHQSPLRERQPDYAFQTQGFKAPIFARQHNLAGADPSPLDVGAAAAPPLMGGGGGGERNREEDWLMGEDKEGGGRPGTSKGFGVNVREEGWSPQKLRPSPPRERNIGSEPQRYQLVDDLPRSGVPVLHSPGQLRGLRAPRGRNSS